MNFLFVKIKFNYDQLNFLKQFQWSGQWQANCCETLVSFQSIIYPILFRNCILTTLCCTFRTRIFSQVWKFTVLQRKAPISNTKNQVSNLPKVTVNPSTNKNHSSPHRKPTPNQPKIITRKINMSWKLTPKMTPHHKATTKSLNSTHK